VIILLLTKENYKELLKENTNNEYEFLEDYIKSTTPILCHHKSCGHKWKVAPYEIIKRGSRCPECAKKIISDSKKGDLEKLEKKLIEVYGFNPYKFLSEYKSWRDYIKVECKKCGTVQEITPLNMFNARRKKSGFYPCMVCDFNRKNKGKGLGKRNNIPKNLSKLTKENYRELLKENTNNEYEFLEDYIKSTTPILCYHKLCGHKWKVAPYEIIKRGSRCPECVRIASRNSRTSNIEELKEKLIQKFGYCPYEFLSEYSKTHEKITVRCLECNDVFDIKPNNLLFSKTNAPVCKNCSIERSKINNSLTKEEYEKKLINKFGFNPYIILSYTNMSTMAKLQCKICNDVFEAIPGNTVITKSKYYCPNCNNMKRDDRPYPERLAEVNPNIIPLEEYKGRKVPILHQCLKCGYKWKSTPNNRLSGEGCPKCNNIITQSKGEKEVINFISENYSGEIILKNRSILDGQELDIYLPELKIAIEYNGLYWHNEKYKGKNYHIEKTKLCEEKGIRLIHIFEDEWINKRDIVLLKIRHILGLNNNPKIYARKCYVEEIDNDYKREFLNNNHIQGNDHSSIKLGLWYPMDDGDELVAVMTFSKLRKALGSNGGELDYELSRFATEGDYRVIGAFGKLFKYFTNNYQFNRIVTYADRRWSMGNVYIKHGFNLTHNSKPSYWYVDRNDGTKRLHRYSFRKQELKKLFPEVFNEELTEFEIMDKTNFYRVWDCGNMVFEYKKTRT
jgi:hypothetical protein